MLFCLNLICFFLLHRKGYLTLTVKCCTVVVIWYLTTTASNALKTAELQNTRCHLTYIVHIEIEKTAEMTYKNPFTIISSIFQAAVFTRNRVRSVKVHRRAKMTNATTASVTLKCARRRVTAIPTKNIQTMVRIHLILTMTTIKHHPTNHHLPYKGTKSHLWTSYMRLFIKKNVNYTRRTNLGWANYGIGTSSDISKLTYTLYTQPDKRIIKP